MRPTRLEISGFASFREPTELDLSDVELFVLTGPTGSGKSSVIDAMTFCLYGSVPRYDDKRLVAPVITQGKLEARVRLDFTVEDEAYTAVRVVRRTRSGASTKEARLEQGDRTLADSADALTAAVESLLGLSFEHFTRTVVLPQGDFQQFLHARPSERQDLLVRLLDLDIYRRVAGAARVAESAATAVGGQLRARLDGALAEATDAAVTAAHERSGALQELLDGLDEARPQLDDLLEQGRAARAAVDEATAARDAVAGLEAPAGSDELAERLAAATAAIDEADLAARSATERLDEVRRSRAGRPATAVVERLADAVQQAADAAGAVEAKRPTVERASRLAREAELHRERAAADVRSAEVVRDELRRAHTAHELAGGLTAGDPCPVCERPLTTTVDRRPPDDIDTAEQRVIEARRALEVSEDAAREAQAAAARATADLEAAQRSADERARRRDEHAAEHDLPADHDAVVALLADLRSADDAVTAAERADAGARTRLQQARDAAADLDTARQQAWAAFDAARDAVAALGPPRPARDDLAAAWKHLLAWADERTPELERTLTRARDRIEQARQRYRDAVAVLTARADAQGVAVAPPGAADDPFTRLRDAVRDAAIRARGDADRLERQRVEAAEVRDQLATAERRVQLSAAVHRHLSAKRFEKWLLNRALSRLVDGASGTLQELSGGAYSLALGPDNNFLVIDHRNADEARSARTLSGGETFLASLSLALSLAEDVAAIAAHGTARLEALFLDEGFGTLDVATLDVVAAAIEELGTTGRQVGLVTHVRELAERIPVRFEVRRDGATSAVRKVVV